MDDVLLVVALNGPMLEAEIVAALSIANDPDAVGQELRHCRNEGLLEQDLDGYWGLTAAGVVIAARHRQHAMHV